MSLLPDASAIFVFWKSPATGTVTGYDVNYTAADAATAANDDPAQSGDSTAGWVAFDLGGFFSRAIILDLTPEQDYRIRVRARNAAGAGPWTFVTARTGPPTLKPLNLKAAAGDAQIEVTWDYPQGRDPGRGVHLDYTSAPKSGEGAVADEDAADGTDAAAAWVRALASSALSHTITGLDNDTEYRVRVRLVNNAGGGPWEFATATPLSSDATLSALTIETSVDGTGDATEVTLSPAFSSTEKSYVASDYLDSSHGSIKVTFTKGDSDATVKAVKSATSDTPDWDNVESVSDEIAFDLDDVSFRILVRVTAEDGSTQDYRFGTFSRQAEVGFEDTALTVDEDVPQEDAAPQAANARVVIRAPGMREAAGSLEYAAGDTDPADLDTDLGSARPANFSIGDGDGGTVAVDIPIVPDGVNEAHETFTVTLGVTTLQTAATGVTVKDDAKTVTVTIKDNDPPTAPASFALTRRNERLVATWTKPAGPVASYQLQYKTQDAPDMRVPAATRGRPGDRLADPWPGGKRRPGRKSRA